MGKRGEVFLKKVWYDNTVKSWAIHNYSYTSEKRLQRK